MISINGTKLDTFKFPIGESNVKFKEEYFSQTLNVHYLHQDMSEFFFLILLLKELKHNQNKIVLSIPYLPFSREDRKIDKQTFTLKYLIELLNDLELMEIRTNDVHAPNALKNLKNHKDTSLIMDLFNSDYNRPDVVVLFPDKGAYDRYFHLFPKYQKLIANKTRDSYGKIIDFNIDVSFDLTGKSVVIVDDLCCRGGTFMACGTILKERYGVSHISLIVTHCETSIYDGEIFISDIIDEVITTDSLLFGVDNAEDKLEINTISNLFKNMKHTNTMKLIKIDNGIENETNIALMGDTNLELLASAVSVLIDNSPFVRYELDAEIKEEDIVELFTTRRRLETMKIDDNAFISEQSQSFLTSEIAKLSRDYLILNKKQLR